MNKLAILAALLLPACGYTMGETCGPSYAFVGSGYPFGAHVGVAVPFCVEPDTPKT